MYGAYVLIGDVSICNGIYVVCDGDDRLITASHIVLDGIWFLILNIEHLSLNRTQSIARCMCTSLKKHDLRGMCTMCAQTALPTHIIRYSKGPKIILLLSFFNQHS